MGLIILTLFASRMARGTVSDILWILNRGKIKNSGIKSDNLIKRSTFYTG